MDVETLQENSVIIHQSITSANVGTYNCILEQFGLDVHISFGIFLLAVTLFKQYVLTEYFRLENFKFAVCCGAREKHDSNRVVINTSGITHFHLNRISLKRNLNSIVVNEINV